MFKKIWSYIKYIVPAIFAFILGCLFNRNRVRGSDGDTNTIRDGIDTIKDESVRGREQIRTSRDEVNGVRTDLGDAREGLQQSAQDIGSSIEGIQRAREILEGAKNRRD